MLTRTPRISPFGACISQVRPPPDYAGVISYRKLAPRTSLDPILSLIDTNHQYCAGLLACSQVTTYTGLMVARVIHCFGSSVCEALPVQLVNDIFFLHERGKRLGYYTGVWRRICFPSPWPRLLTALSTVCLCFGATGPLYAGYMLAGGYSWRLFFYVEFAFACALLIMAFFVVEETLYHRKSPAESVRGSTSSPDGEKNSITIIESPSGAGAIPPRKTFLQTLKFWGVWEKDTDFFMMMARSFTYFLVPHVLWVITTYGKSPARRPSPLLRSLIN